MFRYCALLLTRVNGVETNHRYSLHRYDLSDERVHRPLYTEPFPVLDGSDHSSPLVLPPLLRCSNARQTIEPRHPRLITWSILLVTRSTPSKDGIFPEPKECPLPRSCHPSYIVLEPGRSVWSPVFPTTGHAATCEALIDREPFPAYHNDCREDIFSDVYPASISSSSACQVIFFIMWRLTPRVFRIVLFCSRRYSPPSFCVLHYEDYWS